MERATRLLFLLFLGGFALTLLAFVDLQWTHRVLVKPTASAPPPSGAEELR